MSEMQKAPPKKAYELPRLFAYGDLSEITKQGGKGRPDMTKGNSMT